MSANCRTHKHCWITGGSDWEERLRLVIKKLVRSCCFLFSHLCGGKSSNENELSIPRGLKDFSWGKLTDVKFFVRVSNVSDSCDHLIVTNLSKHFDSKNVKRKMKALNHINLSSFDFIIFIFLIPKSIFIKPIVNFSFNVKMLSEIAWSCRGKPEFWFFSCVYVTNELFVLSLIVLSYNAKWPRSGTYRVRDWGDKRKGINAYSSSKRALISLT